MIMNIAELKDSVMKLNKNELMEVASLINQLLWDDWDRQIAKDFDEGRLDFLMREADEAMESLTEGNIKQCP